MEHVNGAGLQVEGVLEVLAVLLLLLGVETVLDLDQLPRLLPEQRYELLYLLLAPHKAPYLADPL